MRPLGYEFNSAFRTYKPKIMDAVNWFGRGHIGDEGFKEFMHWHGVEDQWFDEYKRSACRETSYFMLNAIAREGMYDEKKFQFWFIPKICLLLNPTHFQFLNKIFVFLPSFQFV